MSKWKIFKFSVIALLIFVLVISRFALAPAGVVVEDPYPTNNSSSVVLAKKIMEDVAQGGSSAPVAARLYAYPLLAADLVYHDDRVKDNTLVNKEAVALLSGALVYRDIHPNPFVKAGAGSLVKKGYLMLEDKSYRESVKYANKYAEKIIKLAKSDGYDKSVRSYKPPTSFGKYTWRPNGFDKQAPLESGWGSLTTINSGSRACSISLPEMSVFDKEVLDLAKQDDILGTSANVIWWLAGGGTPTPSGQWLNIAINAIKDYKLETREASNLLAEMAVGGFDSSVMIWYYKYKFNIIRPQNLYNELTGKYFNLYRDTPNHPSFPGGHSGFGGSAASILIKYIGDSPIRDFLGEDVLVPKEVRTFNSVSEAVKLASKSRVDAKFHYPVDTVAGEQLGNCVGSKINIGDIVRERNLV